jgi:hypothetical protein
LFRLRWTALLGWLFCVVSMMAACSAPIRVEWSTETEMNTAGFNVYRGESPDGPFDIKVNAELIPAAPDPLSGGNYSLMDRSARPGVTYYYRLEEVEKTGQVSFHGPIQTRVSLFNGPQALILVALALVVLGLWVRGGRRSARPPSSKQPEPHDAHD